MEEIYTYRWHSIPGMGRIKEGNLTKMTMLSIEQNKASSIPDLMDPRCYVFKKKIFYEITIKGELCHFHRQLTKIF